MSIAILVVTDGRDAYLRDCVESLHERVVGDITERWMYDDTGDEEYRRRLAATYPEFTHINAGPRQGFGGAIAAAWSRLWQESTASYVFHVEADFTFNQLISLDLMARVLDMQPHLVQLALRRQPWAPVEHAAGGVIEMHPEAYEQAQCRFGRWLEHRLFFTTNPSVYRRSLIGRGWPDVPRSEQEYTHYLLRNGTPEVGPEQVRFAFWGARTDRPQVHHIGHERTGTGY